MPKTYKIIITSAARDDLHAIHDYIAHKLLSPTYAAKYVSDIEIKISALNTLPNGYALVDFEPWRSRGLRHFTVRNFVVYYIVIEESSAVYILDIIYGRRNQLKALREDQ